MTRDGEAGFSLLEVLVVLALLATMAGVTLISFGSGSRGDRAETEAILLANRLSLASDEALVTGRDLSLGLDPTGYRVDVWSAENQSWEPYAGGLLFGRHDVPGGMSLDVDGDLDRLWVRPDATGDPVGITVSDSDGSWRVSYDGLVARAAPSGR